MMICTVLTKLNRVFTLDGNPLDRVEEHKYLDSYIKVSPNIDRDIDIRIGKALGSYNSIKSIWRDKNLRYNQDEDYISL